MALGNIIRFIFTGSNESAIRAMREVGEESEVTSKRVVAGNEEQAASFHATVESTKRLRDSVIGLAGIAGIGGLVFGIKDVVEAGTRWRADQAQLISSLKATGTYSTRTLNQINAATAASSIHGGFSDVTQSAGVTRFITQLGSVGAALKANAAVTAVARRLNIGYSQALSIVARANAGTTGRLQQYLGTIIPITKYTDNMTAAEKRLYPQMYRNAQLENKRATAMMVNRLILQKMGNATAAFGKTAEGAISNAGNAFQLLQQFLGSKLLPAIKNVANWLAGVALAVLNHWPAIWRVIRTAFSPLTSVIKWLGGIRTLAVAVGIVLGEWVTYAAVLRGMAIATALWGAAMKAVAIYEAYASVGMGGLTGAWAAFNGVVDLNPVMLALAALALGIALIVTHFKTFKSVVASVFNWFRGAISTVINFVKAHWQLILEILTFPITGFLLFAVFHFNQIVSFIAGIPGKIAKIGVHLWDGLKSGLISVANWIIRFINSTFGTIKLPFGLGSIHLFTIGQISNGTTRLPAGKLGGAGVPSSASSAPYMPQRSNASATPVPAVAAATGAGAQFIGHTHIYLDRRQIAEGVTHYTLAKNSAS